MRFAATVGLVLVLFLGGSIQVQADGQDVLNFSDVSNRHFHALHVDRQIGAPSDAPLVLYVEPMGDAKSTNLSEGYEWLRSRYNVVVVPRDGGIPLYLTKRDLVGSQGTDALGATIPTGMVVETRSPTLLGCIVVHEIGHALGLKHVAGRRDIMATRCEHGKLEWASTNAEQRAHVASIESMTAYTLGGKVVWAERAAS